MKRLIVNVMNKIEENREKERRYQEMKARARARKAREQYYEQLLMERAERLRRERREERRLYIQGLIDQQLKEGQK